MARNLRARSRMNCIGPSVIIFCFVLNLWTVLIFYVFPFTSVFNFDLDVIDQTDGLQIHYIVFAFYVLLLTLTMWSFIAAACLDPGKVPSRKTSYDKASLP